MQQRAPQAFSVAFSTSVGNFSVRVTRSKGPLGADRFYNLVTNHFYDGARFYRVLPDSKRYAIAQFGVNGNPNISYVYNYLNNAPDAILPDEPMVPGVSNVRGSVSWSASYTADEMATNRTAELFVNLHNNPKLDSHGFAPFGVIDPEGMEVVDQFFAGYGEMPDVCRMTGRPVSECHGPEEARLYSEGERYGTRCFLSVVGCSTASLCCWLFYCFSLLSLLSVVPLLSAVVRLQL
jgi:homoserine O-acetyltransferase